MIAGQECDRDIDLYAGMRFGRQHRRKWIVAIASLTALAGSLWYFDRAQNASATVPTAFDLAPYSASYESYVPPLGDADAYFSGIEGQRLTALEVQKLQRALQMRGFRPGPADGIPGRQTLAALNAYRTSVDLIEVRKISRDAAGDLLP
jgi:hypothetical protein